MEYLLYLRYDETNKMFQSETTTRIRQFRKHIKFSISSQDYFGRPTKLSKLRELGIQRGNITYFTEVMGYTMKG